jgi:hypothetical protein
MSVDKQVDVIIPTVVRSKNNKKNLGEQKFKSLRTCCMCSIAIPSVIDVLRESQALIPVLGDVVASFLEYPNNPIGYISMHKNTRRRHHVVCIKCHENMTDVRLSATIPDYITICPHTMCCKELVILDTEQNVVDG